jgi:hypothetical protein
MVVALLAAFPTVVSSADAPAAAAVPAPLPGQGVMDATAPTGTQPYRRVPRPTSVPGPGTPAVRPEPAPTDKLAAAWNRGEISDDDYIRWSLQRIAQPERLPSRLRPAGALPESTGTTLGHALGLADRGSPATREWVKGMLTGTGTGTGPAGQPAGRQARPAASAAWVDCVTEDDPTFLFRKFDCQHRTATSPPIVVHYNIEGVSRRYDSDGTSTPLPGLPAVDRNSNGIPDRADEMIASFTIAMKRYQAWGYQIDGQQVLVYVGIDTNENPGIVFPTGGILQGTSIIMLPSDPGRTDPSRYTYLPRHELFHAFQYHYMTASHFSANVTPINWWMEATAEWATHQLYNETEPSAPGWADYAWNLNKFLGDPALGLNAHDGLGGGRQYGAFILPQYLTERTDFRFVLRTWQEMGDQLPVGAIRQVLEGYGRDLRTDLVGFALANYRLTGASGALSEYVGAADGYVDPHASGVWRNRLPMGRPTPAASRTLAWGRATSGGVPVAPGGVAYLEIEPARGQGQLRVRVDAPDAAGDTGLATFRYLLVTWDNWRSLTPRRWSGADVTTEDPTAQELVVDLDEGQVATLIAVRTDVRMRPGELVAKPVNWQAELISGRPAPPAGPNNALNAMWARHADRSGYAAMCDDWSGGDGTQSVLLPNGRRAWFFSDTYLGDGRLRPSFDKSILRNSIVIQRGLDPATATLDTVTGGNTCRERDNSLPLADRYAHSPVRSNVSGPDIGGEYYWSATGKVLGDNVVWFYLKGNGFAFKNSSMVVIPTRQLGGGVVNAVPMDLPAHSFHGVDNPIVWGSSLVDDPDGYTYVYGWAVVDANHNKKPFLARVPRPSLTNFGAWRFYTGGGRWSAEGGAAGQARVVPLDTPFTDPMYSVVTLNGRHWLVTLDPVSRRIVAYPSTTPWGFSTARVDLYSPPERLQQSPDFKLIYDLHVHAGLSRDDNTLVVSYNVNSTGVNIGCRPEIEYEPQLYRARFVNIAKAAFNPAAASAKAPAGAGALAAAPGRAAASDARGGRGTRVPSPAALAAVKAPSTPPAEATAKVTATAKARAAAEDRGYYNSWSFQRDIDRQNNHVGCPYLPAPTGLTSRVVNSWGWIELNWQAIGPDVGYKIYEYNVTKQQHRRRPWDWTFGPPRTIGVLDGYPDDRGSMYEWYLVPVNVWGQPESTSSNRTRSLLPIL